MEILRACYRTVDVGVVRSLRNFDLYMTVLFNVPSYSSIITFCQPRPLCNIHVEFSWTQCSYKTTHHFSYLKRPGYGLSTCICSANLAISYFPFGRIVYSRWVWVEICCFSPSTHHGTSFHKCRPYYYKKFGSYDFQIVFKFENRFSIKILSTHKHY